MSGPSPSFHPAAPGGTQRPLNEVTSRTHRPPSASAGRRPGGGSEARPASRGVAVTCQAQITCEAGAGRTPELSHSREMNGDHVTGRGGARRGIT